MICIKHLYGPTLNVLIYFKLYNGMLCNEYSYIGKENFMVPAVLQQIQMGLMA